ncbi:hypothetical protein PYCCODRAFT_1480983 [Trametes coccinea BRFM310]|uniref:F-box domain-containing protein n=1 Tax=Trametes coccinea (strain BRFM310) TaxID=1353009 RepID=A0A1Y2IA60_TRAC3|nr:hypothetical protein PYCCODRAFT_1480983 [Trametes coccinea BRFM310]
MGQYWYLLNLDRRERAYGAKLGEWYPSEDYRWLEQRLKIPRLSPNIDRWIAQGKRAVQRGSLLKLPNEMIDEIFTELRVEDPVSMVCFAVACKELLSLGKPHAYKLMKAECRSWINHRLICVGDYGSNLPQGLLTAEEEAAIEGMREDDEYPPTLYSLAAATFDSHLDAFDDAFRFAWFESPQYDIMCHESIRRQTPTQKNDWRMITSLLSPAYDQGPAVLCNMSKGECVRQDALNLPAGISLGHVLVSQICCSDDPSCSMVVGEDFEKNFERGRWVGDRFCIATVSTMPKLTGGAEWKDVTCEVHELLCHLCYENPEDFDLE